MNLTDDQFDALVNMIDGYMHFAKVTTGREPDVTFMEAKRRELDEVVLDAREKLVGDDD